MPRANQKRNQHSMAEESLAAVLGSTVQYKALNESSGGGGRSDARMQGTRWGGGCDTGDTSGSRHQSSDEKWPATGQGRGL